MSLFIEVLANGADRSAVTVDGYSLTGHRSYTVLPKLTINDSTHQQRATSGILPDVGPDVNP